MEHARIGPYRVVRQLGAGGMGVVFEALHEQIGRRAAIKVLHAELAKDAELARRFLNEARSVNVVRHPGIVEIIDYGQLPDGTPYLVMEFLEGESLYARLKRQGGTLSEGEVLPLAHQMAQALAAAHEKGIIHRDLKPDNAMVITDPVTGAERVKLLDFGIAKLLFEQEGQANGDGASRQLSDPRLQLPRAGGRGTAEMDRYTNPNASLGTMSYMAPEQHSSAAAVTDKADVFSFGVTLYELLSGHVPFQGISVLVRDAPPLAMAAPRVSQGTCHLIDRMMRREPSQRPSMAEVAAALAAMLPREKIRLPRWVRALAAAFVGVLLLSAGLGIWVYRRVASRALPVDLAPLRARALAMIKQEVAGRDPTLRRAALAVLGGTGDVRLRPFIEPLLADPDHEVRASAAEALGALGDPGARAALRAALSSAPPAGFKVAIGAALDRLGDEQGRRVLMEGMSSEDAQARLRAALILCERGVEEASSQLRSVLDRGQKDELAIAIEVRLARAGDTAARQALRARLHPPTGSDLQLSVAAQLAELGEEEGLGLLRQVVRQRGRGQLIAARLLASLGDASALGVLRQVAAAAQSPENARVLSAQGLGDGGEVEDAVLLAALLDDAHASPLLRHAAAAALLRLSGTDPGVLTEQSLNWARLAVGDDSWALREAAAAVLGEVEQPGSVKLLSRLLSDREPRVRRSAVRALSRLRSGDALAALARGLTDQDLDVRRETLRAISEAGPRIKKERGGALSGDLRGKVARVLEGSQGVERVLAAGALLRLGAEDKLPLLREALASPSPDARRAVLEQLPADDPALLDALGDTDGDVRFVAARRLAERGATQAIPALREALERGGVDGSLAYALLRRLGASVPVPKDIHVLLHSQDVAVRLKIADAVERLPAKEALPLLGGLARDPSPAVRARAAQAAASMGGSPGARQLLRQLVLDGDAGVRALAGALLSREPGADAAMADAAHRKPGQPAQRSGDPPSARIIRDGGDSDPGPPDTSAGSGAVRGSPGEAARAASLPTPSATQAEATARFGAGVEAFSRKDYGKARRLLESVQHLCLRDRRECSAIALELSYHLGRIYDAEGQWAEAMTEYERLLKLRPSGKRERQRFAEVRSAMARLTPRLGRLRVRKYIAGRCQTVEVWMRPGKHRVEMGGRQGREVVIRAGQISTVEVCP